jgi:signal recognition particle receptor subunit beta
MATIDVTAREIHAKIVYYGPGLSGKTTNLRNIHDRMLPELRGPIRAIETELERTLFFDFLSTNPVKLGGWSIRYHVYSVPGQDDYVRTRRAILGGADGVVFVADSGAEQREANRVFLTELVDHLDYYARDIATYPVVFQFNKMDLDDAATHEELDNDLNGRSAPAIDAIAINGNGVSETLAEIIRLVTQTL